MLLSWAASKLRTRDLVQCPLGMLVDSDVHPTFQDFTGIFFRKYATPAEKPGDAMRLLCMNPTAEEAS